MARFLGEEVVEYFERLPNEGRSAEERVATTAEYFRIKPGAVHRHLKFWWPGEKYLREFGSAKGRGVRWDRPTGEILKALHEHGSVAQAAKVLGTTAVTLGHALERHRIVRRWMVEELPEQSDTTERKRGRPRRRPPAKHLWTE